MILKSTNKPSSTFAELTPFAIKDNSQLQALKGGGNNPKEESDFNGGHANF